VTTAPPLVTSIPSMASFHQLPPVSNAPPPSVSSGRAMAILLELFVVSWPRIIILGFWIFSDLLGEAYEGWVIPAVGFLVAPFTTIAYAGMWGVSSDGVFGAEWLVVAVAVLADVGTWALTRALR
jgi:hypothetical protein